MITFYMILEIDGFFIAEKEFDIKDYNVEEYHLFNRKESGCIITKGTPII